MGLIVEINLDWVSPLVIVPKKGGKLRMCIDFRYLNENIIKTKYYSSFIYKDIVNYLHEENAECFAVLDLLSGYWQLLIA